MANLLFLCSGLALLLAWLYPNHFLPWMAFYNEFLAAIALLLLASATFWRRPLHRNLSVPRPALIVFLVALLPLLQFATGLIRFGGDAWIASLYLAGFLLAYVTGHRLGAPATAMRLGYALSGVLVLGTLISLFLATHQWLQTGYLANWSLPLAADGRPYANLAQPNNLATLLCLGLAATLYLRERSRIGTSATVLLVLLLLSGIVITGSRTPVVILGVMAGWVWWNQARLGLKTSYRQLLVAAAVFSLLWALLPILHDALYLSGKPANVSGLLAERMRIELRPTIWRQLLEAALQKPLVGYGWGQVSYAQIAVAALYPQSIAVEHSHNIVLDLLLWNGIALGGLLTLAIAWWLLSRMRRCTTLESWFALSVILIVGTHGLLEYPLEYAYFLLPVGLCAGMVDSGITSRPFQINASLTAGFVLAGWLAVTGVFVGYQKAEDDFRHMRFESIGVEAKKSGRDTTAVPILSQLSEFTRFARTEATEGMEEDELIWMEQVAHRHPSPPALFRYALALGLNHHYDQAALELIRLQRLHPPMHIEEAKQGWLMAAEQYPMLNHVPLPP